MDFVNRWVFKTDSYPITPSEEWRNLAGGPKQNAEEKIHDINTAVSEWAIVTDVHSGFQRLDGRNLMGFMDGISQPERLRNDDVWTTGNDEIGALIDGTYMVFQKIEHDLEQWEKLGVREQERWVGRSKGTGLLLGTLSREQDEKLADDCRSNNSMVSQAARSRLKKLLMEQEDPSKPFYSSLILNIRTSNLRLAGQIITILMSARIAIIKLFSSNLEIFSWPVHDTFCTPTCIYSFLKLLYYVKLEA